MTARDASPNDPTLDFGPMDIRLAQYAHGAKRFVAGEQTLEEKAEMQSIVVGKLARTVVPGLCAAAVTLIVGIAVSQPAQADEADAKRLLLKAMSDYLAAQKSISFDYDTNLEIVTADLQKLALASSGAITVNRLDKVWR